MAGLNPEAAEFRPIADSDLELLIEKGYLHMNKATRACNSFPIEAALALFRAFTDFTVVISKISKNMFSFGNKIVGQEGQVPMLISEDDDESNAERIAEVNDAMLDRVGGAVDVLAGERSNAAPAPAPAAWNRNPTLATVQVKTASASLISAKNIARPQLSFKDPVDNSESVFIPRISDKPNALTPLALTITYGPDGQPTGYEHPYKTELEMYCPPPWALQHSEGPPPQAIEDTPLTMVETPEALYALVEHLDGVAEMAVDLEHHSYRTYQGFTCIIQLSTDSGGDFIVDALALREHLHVLNRVFTHPGKIKVLHGADRDVLWLQRDFGVYLVGLFDTHQAARMLPHPGASLKHLLKRYCNIEADKTCQLADWRMRPLPADLVQYARSDTHHLLRIWRLMRAELLTFAPHALYATFQKSQQIATTTYSKPVLKADSHMAVYGRSGKRFNAAQMAALRAIWVWRDQHARELDESPGYLLPNHMLLTISEVLPRDLQGLRALCVPPPPFFLNRINDVHQIVISCRCVPDAPSASSMPPAVRAMADAPLTPHTRDSRIDERFMPETRVKYGEPAPSCSWPEMHTFTTAGLPSLVGYPYVYYSPLNAEASSFVPPFVRYQAYRVSTQAEEMAAMQLREARVEALGHGSEVIRDAVLRPLQAALPTEPLAGPSNASQAWPSTAPQAGPSTAPQAGPSSAPQAGPSYAPQAGPSYAPQAGPSSAPQAGPSTASPADFATPEPHIFRPPQRNPPAENVSPRKRKHDKRERNTATEAGPRRNLYANPNYSKLRTDKDRKHHRNK